MQYIDFIVSAKRYNNVFNNLLGLHSLKSPLFILGSMSLLIMVALMVLYVIKGGFSNYWGSAYFCASLVFEMLAAAFISTHLDRSRKLKIDREDLGIAYCEDLKFSSVYKKAWIAKRLDLEPSEYSALVKQANEIEADLEKQKINSNSIFSNFLSFLLSAQKLVKGINVLFAIPVIGLIIKQLVDADSLSKKVSELMSGGDPLKKLYLLFSLVVIMGFIIFLISLLGNTAGYLIDLSTGDKCSKRSLSRFKEDLLRFSELKIEKTKPKDGQTPVLTN